MMMHRTSRPGAAAGLAAGLAAVLATTLALPAHGGRYRGPKDIVPPGTRPHTPSRPGAPGGRPTTPGPVAPGPTTPGGPGRPGAVTPGGRSPGGSRPGPFTPGGYAPEPDFGQWDFWWEFNKDPYLQIKDSLYHAAPTTGDDHWFMGATRRTEGRFTNRPSAGDVRDRILPALRRALDNTRNNDITTGCLVAIAKIGEHDAPFALLEVLRPHLQSSSQEVRETAALTLGIARIRAAVPLLTDLALDTAAGRRAVGHAQVDDRTRSFAIYGLGMVAYGSADPLLKRKVFETCAGILEAEKVADRNVAIAAILATGLLNIAGDGAADNERLRGEAVATLDRFFDRKLGRGAELIQSHTLTAIARLLGRGTGKAQQTCKQKLVDQLQRRSDGKRSMDVHRAAVLALGELAEADAPADAFVSAALRRYFDSGKDPQARSFSLIALARIGGGENRNFLLGVLKRGRKVLERPWAAIALGTLAFEHHRVKGDVDTTVGIALRHALGQAKTPYQRSAIAVALGLCRYRDAATDLLGLLDRNSHQDDLAGYACIGLALMQYDKAKTPIQELVRRALRRPALLKQATIALGKLGDRALTSMLVDMMKDGDQNLAKISAVASALSFIGDRKCIQPLIGLLENDAMPNLSRAFAAAALGGVADKEKLPWNSKVARGLNYRAAVETLTQSGSGILDIL